MTGTADSQRAIQPDLTAHLPVLDAHAVSALRAFGRQPGKLLGEMASAFLAETPALMAEIESTAATESLALTGKAAHKLKGVSGHIGAARLAAAAGAVEQSAASGD